LLTRMPDMIGRPTRLRFKKERLSRSFLLD
jgi:hypothetical protein